MSNRATNVCIVLGIITFVVFGALSIDKLGKGLEYTYGLHDEVPEKEYEKYVQEDLSQYINVVTNIIGDNRIVVGHKKGGTPWNEVLILDNGISIRKDIIPKERWDASVVSHPYGEQRR